MDSRLVKIFCANSPSQQARGANDILVVPGADKMSAVPDRLGLPSSGRLTDPMTNCRQGSEQTPSGPHRITPDRRQV